MVNPNNKIFWNKRIRDNREEISRSPIFVHKNNIVLRELSSVKGRILNIGVGYGFIEEKLVLNKDIDLYGIDISNEAISYAKGNFKGNFRVASSVSIPFKSNFFNYILALDVFEHLYENELLKTMREIHRVLNKNGKLIISVPINESFKNSRLNRHVRKYTLEKLRFELKNFGFGIQDIILLSAFPKLYWIKQLINSLLHFRRPNLLIVLAIKK